MHHHSVTSPISSFEKIVLCAFLNIKSTDIHCFKLLMVWLFLSLSCQDVSTDSLLFIAWSTYFYFGHRGFVFKKQSFTFLVVTIPLPLVFLNMLQVCQEKLQNKFSIVIITNKSHWHLGRKTPPPYVLLPRWQTYFKNSDETLCKFCYSVMIINHYSLKHSSSLEPQSQIILSFWPKHSPKKLDKC